MAQTGHTAAVDWITVTARDAASIGRLGLIMMDVLAAERAAGNDWRDVKEHGYYGKRCGAALWAESDDAAMATLTGGRAGSLWRAIAVHAANVSRLDIQVTCWPAAARPAVDHAAAGYQHVVAGTGNAGAQLTAQLIESHPTGATLYLGAPASDKRARLYDKAAESGEEYYAGSWRYELQLRRKPAVRMMHHLLECDGEHETIANAVWSHFQQRGLQPAFDAGSALSISSEPPAVSDDGRRLVWLRDQVRFTVARLVERRGREVVMDALGLATSSAPYRGTESGG